MDITGIAKSHQTNSTAAGKASSKKEWKLSDSLREKITEYAREDAAQNEKDGDLTAMGKSLWHYATIGHILKNRLYCGELEYRKEYVPDYLEQKRAKNNGELDRVIVEGKHQPIVTKEEFERVQGMLAERSAEARNCRKNKGVCSDDLWRRKLRCQCGHAFAKTKWHTKTDFITYTYECYDQTRTGTLKSASAVLGCGIAGVEQAEVLRDKSIIEERLKKERRRYETLLDMRMNNEIPKEVFSRKQQGWRSGSGSWNSR